MFVPPKQQQQDALIVVIDHNKIHGGFAIDPCECFNLEAPDMQDGIIHNFLSFQQVLNKINLKGHQEQSQIPLILIVSRDQLQLQELSQHIFLNTEFKTIGLIYRDTALIFYQSRQTCIIVDFKQRSISILLCIDGVTDDMVVVERSSTIDERVFKVLQKNCKEVNLQQEDTGCEAIKRIVRHFDNEQLAYELRNSALIQDLQTGVDLWALHSAARCPNAVLEQIAKACQRFQQLRPGQTLPIVLTGEYSKIQGLEHWLSTRLAQLPRGSNCRIIAAGDRASAEFLGAAAAAQVIQEQLFFTELDPWDSDVSRAVFQ